MSLAFFSLTESTVSRVKLDAAGINVESGELWASIVVAASRVPRAVYVRLGSFNEVQATRVASNRYTVRIGLESHQTAVESIWVRTVSWEGRKKIVSLRLPKNVFDSGAIDQLSICLFDSSLRANGRFPAGAGSPVVSLNHAPLVGKSSIDSDGRWEFSGQLATVSGGALFEVPCVAQSELDVFSQAPDGLTHRLSHKILAEQLELGVGRIEHIEAERDGQRLYARGYFLSRDCRGRVVLERDGIRLPRAAKQGPATSLEWTVRDTLDDDRPGWEWAGEFGGAMDGAVLRATLEVDGKPAAWTSTIVGQQHMVDQVGYTDLYYDSPYRTAFLELLEERHDPLEPTIIMVFPGDLSGVFGGGPSRVVSMARYLRSMGYQILSIERVNPEVPTDPQTSAQLDEVFTRRWCLRDDMLGDFAALAIDEIESGPISEPEYLRILASLQNSAEPVSDTLISRRMNVRFNALAGYLIANTKPECAIVNFAWTASILELVPDGALKILDTHDIQYKRAPMIAAATGDAGLYADVDEERELWLKADIVLAIQPGEKDEIIEVTGRNNVVLASHGVDVPELQSVDDASSTLLFIGNRYEPNIVGLQKFMQQVWPQIRAAAPDTTLEVVGAVVNGISEWPEGVIPLGIVPELDVYYRRATIVINPVEIGSGLNIKTVEALAFGKALVSTPFGLKGLPADVTTDSSAISVELAEMAASIIQLLGNPAQRQALEVAARDYALRWLSPQAVFNELKNTLELRLF